MASLLLLVDDDPLVLITLEGALQDAGYDTRSCNAGQEALAAFAEQPDAVSALVTDVRMAGMNGWDLAHRLRELKPLLPVVYVTGDSGHGWAAHGVPNSVLVEKPFAPVQIVTAVANLLNVTHVAAVPPPPAA